MNKSMEIKDFKNGKIFLRTLSFAGQVLYFVLKSKDMLADVMKNKKESEWQFKFFCSDLAESFFEEWEMDKTVYTQEQRMYMITFAAMVLGHGLTDPEIYQYLKKTFKKTENLRDFLDELFVPLITTLQDYDTEYTKMRGAIREDVPKSEDL